MILKICEVFGNVKNIEYMRDQHNERFIGVVNVEFSTELEAKRA
jgi:hypothetical protein